MVARNVGVLFLLFMDLYSLFDTVENISKEIYRQ